MSHGRLARSNRSRPTAPIPIRTPTTIGWAACWCTATPTAAARSLIGGTDFGDNIMGGLPDTIGQTIGNMMAGAVAGPAGGATQTVQPKAIQIPALDASGIPVPYINADGSISSVVPYAGSSVSGVDAGAAAPDVETVVVSANAWSDSQKEFFDYYDREAGGSRWYAPQNLFADEIQRVQNDPILHGGGVTGRNATADAVGIDILRTSLPPVDIAIGAYNVATGKAGLRDYLAVGGAAAGPILGKVAGVAAPLISRLGRAGEIVAEGAPIISEISTPWGSAVQSTMSEALAARSTVENGATLYRLGTLGKSEAAGAQFWALENPLTTPNYAARYGIPAENVQNFNFVETATLKPGTPFVTRVAPGIGENPGGGIEVVVPKSGVNVLYFGGH